MKKRYNDLADRVGEVVQEIERKDVNLPQIRHFDECIKKLGLGSEKSKAAYSYPHVDTIGKNTYAHLNKV